MQKSQSVEWATPQAFFDKLDKEFHFTLDVCSTNKNAKCKNHFTKEHNGLAQDWSGNVCWMNPPYGLIIYDWIKKAWEECQKGSTVVILVPARTDTKWFHDYVYDRKNHKFRDNVECRFIKGRIKFIKDGEIGCSPTKPSIIIIFRGNGKINPNFTVTELEEEEEISMFDF